MAFRNTAAHARCAIVSAHTCCPGMPPLQGRDRSTRQNVHSWVTCFHYAGSATALVDAPRSERPRHAGEAIDTLLQTLMILSPERFGHHATPWTVPLPQDGSMNDEEK